MGTSLRVALIAAVAAAAAIASAGCAHGVAAIAPPAWPDAPIELRDEGDRDQQIDALDAMPLGPARDAARAAVADALAARLADALASEDDHAFRAQQLLFQLASLWQRDPAAIAAGLARHTDVIRRARAAFAKSGASEPSLLALFVLAEVDPSSRAAELAEVDDILAFADNAEIAESGADAARAQPIAVLESAALTLPLPAVIDRYVALLEARQRAVANALSHGRPSQTMLHAQRDVLTTSMRIGAALARGGRATEIAAHLGKLDGIGIDRALTARAAIVAEQASPGAYVELAEALRDSAHAGDPSAAGDPIAALATCLAGIARYPHDADLLIAAAEHAQAVGHIEQAIALLEQLPASDASGALRLGGLYATRIERLANGGRPWAATAAWHQLGGVAARSPAGATSSDWPTALASAETALGKGLVADGDLPAGRAALAESITRAPSVEAYEALARVELATDRYREATAWVERGLALLSDKPGDHDRRAKLLGVAGDALRRAGSDREAGEAYLEALRTWAALGDARDLPRPLAAERMLESGEILWWLGDRDRGTELVVRAVDVDGDTAQLAIDAVGFLLEIDRPDDAIEAVHRALVSVDITDAAKTYLALWLVGDAHRRGAAPDRVAVGYLAGRTGAGWSDLLAQAATGRASPTSLQAAAITGPRRAELAFYAATLGLGSGATASGARALLRQVVASNVVLGTEYDLARAYLAR